MWMSLIVGVTVLGQLKTAIGEEGGEVSSRIYYGQNARRGQFPFIAWTIIHLEGKGYVACGASLITGRWLVSAAHCSLGADSVNAQLGLWNKSDSTGSLSYMVPKSGIFVHPGYTRTKSPSPDIALYKLPSNVPVSNNIKPIPIANVGPNSVTMYDGALVTTAGWGQTQSGKGSDILQYAVVKVMRNAECIRRFPPGATKATICTEKRYKNAGVCSGDSGGPLTVNGNHGPELIGITSMAVGAPPCSDPNGGDIYTYVPFYKDWIQKTISSH